MNWLWALLIVNVIHLCILIYHVFRARKVHADIKKILNIQFGMYEQIVRMPLPLPKLEEIEADDLDKEITNIQDMYEHSQMSMGDHEYFKQENV